MVSVTRIQQVLLELETAYLGHPYYVTGNALYQALAQRVDERMRRALCVSHGVFLPKAYGTPPAWYSQESLGKVGVSLPPVESYDDLFLLRDAAQRWLKSSWPRDAQNAHPVQTHGGRLAFDPVAWFGRPPEMQTSKRSVRWFVQCYLHTMSGTHGESLLPVADGTLDRLQVGGARNYGFGRLSLVDSQVIELDELAYDRVTATDDHVLELVSPFVVASEFPNADEQSVRGGGMCHAQRWRSMLIVTVVTAVTVTALTAVTARRMEREAPGYGDGRSAWLMMTRCMSWRRLITGRSSGTTDRARLRQRRTGCSELGRIRGSGLVRSGFDR